MSQIKGQSPKFFGGSIYILGGDGGGSKISGKSQRDQKSILFSDVLHDTMMPRLGNGEGFRICDNTPER